MVRKDSRFASCGSTMAIRCIIFLSQKRGTEARREELLGWRTSSRRIPRSAISVRSVSESLPAVPTFGPDYPSPPGESSAVLTHRSNLDSLSHLPYLLELG